MYKIIKRIHAYSGNNKTTYHIYDKKRFGRWKRCYDFQNEYINYQNAERDIIFHLSKGNGGIIEVDGNVYKLFPISLPTP